MNAGSFWVILWNRRSLQKRTWQGRQAMLIFFMPGNGDTVQYDVVYLKADWKPDLKQTAKNWKVIKETENKSRYVHEKWCLSKVGGVMVSWGIWCRLHVGQWGHRPQWQKSVGFFVQAFKKLAPISNKICEIRHNKVSPGGGETICPRRWQFDPKISAD